MLSAEGDLLWDPGQGDLVRDQPAGGGRGVRWHHRAQWERKVHSAEEPLQSAPPQGGAGIPHGGRTCWP